MNKQNKLYVFIETMNSGELFWHIKNRKDILFFFIKKRGTGNVKKLAEILFTLEQAS